MAVMLAAARPGEVPPLAVREAVAVLDNPALVGEPRLPEDILRAQVGGNRSGIGWVRQLRCWTTLPLSWNPTFQMHGDQHPHTFTLHIKRNHVTGVLSESLAVALSEMARSQHLYPVLTHLNLQQLRAHTMSHHT